MFKRVLVPLDGSPTSERVLPVARALAPEADWTFLRVGDLSLTASIQVVGFRQILRSELQNQLEHLVTKYTGRLGSITSQFEVGDTADAILRESKPGERDLVAMTTHGRTGMARFMLGSVAEKVVRGSEIPVLVVRNEATPRNGETVIKNIAVALDGLPSSEQALKPTVEIARETGATIHFLHVLEVVRNSKDTELGRTILDSPTRFQDRVRHVAADVSNQGIKTEVCVTTGIPEARIVDFCRENPIDLLVMATHGRSGLGRCFLGSVTERVLRNSEAPMLITRCGSG